MNRSVVTPDNVVGKNPMIFIYMEMVKINSDHRWVRSQISC